VRLPQTPQRGFAAHAGYATEVHRQAIALVGPCPHGMSFLPFREDGEKGDAS
jgi:ribonuclease HII